MGGEKLPNKAFYALQTACRPPARHGGVMRHTVARLLLLAAARQCVAHTHIPAAPVGTPGRLPNVLPSSVKNEYNESSSKLGPAAVNITGLIIASSMERFERAAAEVRKSDIHSTVWIPAFFLEEKNYTLCGGGGNGLRHAMRNAWNLIASSGVGMAVFEEDVAYAGVGKNASVSHFVESKCLRPGAKCDLAYLGEWNGFFTTHAIYIPPRTAVSLLELTDTCYPWGVQIDQGMHARCFHRAGRPPYNCIHPPPFKLPHCFGQGFFVQDPVAVPPTLHGGHGGTSRGNKVIARRRRYR